MVHIWAKANIPQMKKDISDFADELVCTDCDATSVEVTYNCIQGALLSTLKNIPKNLFY